MSHPLFKSALWALSGIMLHISCTPPHARYSEKDERRGGDKLMDFLLRGMPIILALSWYITFAEILTIHSASFRRITSFPNASDAATIDPPFLAAFIILSSAFILRISSFRALGDLFTGEVMIRPDHKLITQGPYRFVRHPSYTGIIGIVIGSTMLHLAGTDSWVVKWAFWLWTLNISAGCSRIWWRSTAEDEILRKKFGMEWVSYRERVPYRFVPWIL